MADEQETPKRRKAPKPRAARQTYDLDEVAAKLGIGRNAAYEAAHRGQIPTIKIGRRYLVPAAALDRMLEGSSKAAE